MKFKFLVFLVGMLSYNYSPQATVPIGDTNIARVLDGANKQIGRTVMYDPAYIKLAYPNGDVPFDRGVCTDVIVRAYRHAGIDLQKLVHEDMVKSFSAYPKLWQLKKTDTNIDHRRVPNLAAFFTRYGQSFKVDKQTNNMHTGTPFSAGDIVTWKLSSGVPHIGLITNKKVGDRFLVTHNIGAGTKTEDVLYSYQITGHYRYEPWNKK